MLRIDVLTLFPDMFAGVFGASILGKARERGLVALAAVNFREFSGNKHNTVDDTSYGGGGGMVLKAEPIFRAVEYVLAEKDAAGSGAGGASDRSDDGATGLAIGDAVVKRPRVVLLCPQGEVFTQAKARELAQEDHLILICGHYEGYDERIREHLVTDELSIGDYVLTGGELPAMVVIDAVVRLLPGALGNESSAAADSFSDGLLEYPHYTRPAEFRGWKVPETLLSGNHAEIDRWRRRMSLERTLARRPDLLEQAGLTAEERRWLEGEKKKKL